MSVPQEVLYRMARSKVEPGLHGIYGNWYEQTYGGVPEPEDDEPMIVAMKDAQFQHEMFERIRIYEELQHQFEENSKPNENR